MTADFSSACDSNNLATCTADHFLPRAAGSRAPPSPAATARSDSPPPACSSWMVGASPPRLRTSPRPGMAPTSAWERRQGDSRTRREAATGLLNRHRQSRGRKSAHEKSSAGGRKLATLCLHSPGRAEYILWARVPRGTGFSHAFVDLQLYLRSDAAFTMYFGKCSACSGGTGHHSYSFS